MNADADTHPEHIVAHPLVRAYLQDLDRTLAGTEDRAEVLDAVTEHITSAAAALPGPPTTAQVQDILAGLGPVERIAAAGAPARDREEGTAPQSVPPQRQADGAWLGTPSGIVALVSLILSVFLLPLFLPLAGLSLVLAIIALVRRRPRPRSALVITIISSVLIVAYLAIGILATLALFSVTTGDGSTSEPAMPSPAVTSAPASAPAGQP